MSAAAAEKDAAVREALRIGNEAIEAMQRKSLVAQKQAVQAERRKHEEVVRRLTERFTAVRVQAEQDRDAALAAAEAAEARAGQAADEALKAAMAVMREAQAETARATAALLEERRVEAEAEQLRAMEAQGLLLSRAEVADDPDLAPLLRAEWMQALLGRLPA